MGIYCCRDQGLASAAILSLYRTVMKVLMIVCLGMVALVSARPSDDIIDFETDHMEHEQEGQPGRAVEGEYSWVAPDGNEYVVKYVADHLGYRVIEDNVLPRAVEVEEVDEDDEEPSFRAAEEDDEAEDDDDDDDEPAFRAEEEDDD